MTTKRLILSFGLLAGIASLIACSGSQPDNLIVNGSAELGPVDSLPKGWVNVVGHWRSVEGDSVSHGYAWAKEGKRHFFEGQDLLGILRQDIDVAALAEAIDSKRQFFSFTGYVSAFPQQPPDQSRFVIDAMADTTSKALYHFDSDTISSQGQWRLATDSFLAPHGTRVIRLQLIAQRRNGADNDGYFDDLRLTALPVAADRPWLIPVLIVVALLLCAGFYLAIIKRRSSITGANRQNRS